MKYITKIAALFGLALTLSSCQAKKDPYFFLSPQLPVSQAFALDKVGNKAVIDFWVLPEKQELNKGYTLGFSYFFKDKDVARDIVAKSAVALKVKMSFVSNQTVQNIPLRGSLKIQQPPENFNEGVVFSERFSTGFPDEANQNLRDAQYLLATFVPQQYGHYQAEISTVENKPELSNIDFSLFVKNVSLGK